MEQFIEGTRSNNFRWHLLLHPPVDFEASGKLVEDLKKLEVATSAPRECMVVGDNAGMEVGYQPGHRGQEMQRP
ncbi:unnamed protein product [Echinostoma caproni]|uniref:XRN_N domain-containing protein n=1 Tax=Echinostoma caproni TaxID=27848 RepID=A0A183B0N8_9TREM|nr:unnamed protein product [Echinostoma caproni]